MQTSTRLTDTSASNMPPDVQAYMVAACKQLMVEQGFTANSGQEATAWLTENFQAVCQLARDRMQAMVYKLLGNDRMMATVKEHICSDVYYAIQAQEPGHKKWNPRYAAYAAAHGCTPDEMLQRDGGTMTNFLCWNERK